MATKCIIGSARSDEHGGSGWSGKAKAGDQKQKSTPDYEGEVSLQPWYYHKSGWVVLRPKSEEVARKLAYAMKAACNNKYIGYDQSQRDTLYKAAEKVGFDPARVHTPVETDCSALVRVCCCYAGVDPGNIRTINEPAALVKTGAFEKLTAKKYCTSGAYLKAGDILCTPCSGHTVIVVVGGDGKEAQPKEEKPEEPKTTKTVKATRPAQKKDSNLAGTYKVTAKRGLNLRNGASMKEKVLTVLPDGHKVKNYGFYSLTGTTKWLYVSTTVKDVEYIGFVSSLFLKKC